MAATYQEKGYKEDPFVTSLVDKFLASNKTYWGADLEDSATTDEDVINTSLNNMKGCYDGSIQNNSGDIDC